MSARLALKHNSWGHHRQFWSLWLPSVSYIEHSWCFFVIPVFLCKCVNCFPLISPFATFCKVLVLASCPGTTQKVKRPSQFLKGPLSWNLHFIAFSNCIYFVSQASVFDVKQKLLETSGLWKWVWLTLLLSDFKCPKM